MRRRFELDVRLIETDVRVPADAEDLQINAAFFFDEGIVVLAFSLDILSHAVRMKMFSGLMLMKSKNCVS